MNFTLTKLAMFADTMTPVTVIAAALFWTLSSGPLSAAEIFPSLVIIALVQRPLFTILQAYSAITTATASLDRIQSFLLSEEASDPRQVVDFSGALESPGSAPFQIGDYAVQFSDAFIAFESSQETVLRNINLSIRRSKIIAAVGATGSGKSLLLRAILGDINVISGAIFVHTSLVAFCDQRAWLQNVSIRDNILGYRPMDIPWYNKIVHACLLTEDLQHFTEGDTYLAGSNGSNLSGGQKHRIVRYMSYYQPQNLTSIGTGKGSVCPRANYCARRYI